MIYIKSNQHPDIKEPSQIFDLLDELHDGKHTHYAWEKTNGVPAKLQKVGSTFKLIETPNPADYGKLSDLFAIAEVCNESESYINTILTKAKFAEDSLFVLDKIIDEICDCEREVGLSGIGKRNAVRNLMGDIIREENLSIKSDLVVNMINRLVAFSKLVNSTAELSKRNSAKEILQKNHFCPNLREETQSNTNVINLSDYKLVKN